MKQSRKSIKEMLGKRELQTNTHNANQQSMVLGTIGGKVAGRAQFKGWKWEVLRE